MILIADSGSTKTDWCVVRDGKMVKKLHTSGLNPFYQSEEEISDVIEKELTPQIEGVAPERIFFYGAGCAFPEKNRAIENALLHFFQNAQCEVNSDLLAACRGLLGRSPGVACILGSGSNSCYYDGEEIVSHISPLGFILGDEGSGAALGKRLVADCLKNQLPDELKDKFLSHFKTTPGEILDHVYRLPFPNRYLASLSTFLGQHIDEPECYDIVHDAFVDFFERNVLQYDFSDELPVNFTGSVAFFYQEILERVAAEYGLWIEKIERTPLEGLVLYHASEQKN